jgi:BirA family biotin operon repressor/biotin-[acetyl-CoA-carboxylase] ligase
MRDELDLERLQAGLVGTRFAAGLRQFASVESTNTLLLEAAAAGAAEGTVYVADEQTAGRGRGGHGWHSAAGDGLYVSALVRPHLRLSQALLLSLATGVAAAQAIHEVARVEVDLRWPNDLMVGQKKLGGILVESSVEPGDDPLLRSAVVGIGINVHHAKFPAELAELATSLALESDIPLMRGPLLLALLRALDMELTLLENGSEGGALMQRFTQRSSWVRGKRVSVPEQGGYTGTTAGLDRRGYLQVDVDDGTRRTVMSGGVREL